MYAPEGCHLPRSRGTEHRVAENVRHGKLTVHVLKSAGNFEFYPSQLAALNCDAADCFRRMLDRFTEVKNGAAAVGGGTAGKLMTSIGCLNY
uniref:Uncharacterized protein n=1 Tax=Setaria digitata TaxID=48799 RepID=A0A915PYT2_9BILA